MLSCQECYEKVVLVIWLGGCPPIATLSNCGKVLSNVLYRLNTERSGCGTTGKLVGRVRIKTVGIIRSQVLRSTQTMDAVQRLNVSERRKMRKIESVRSEMRPNEESNAAPYSIGGEQWGFALNKCRLVHVSILQLNNRLRPKSVSKQHKKYKKVTSYIPV
jgi:hypothetical protein